MPWAKNKAGSHRLEKEGETYRKEEILECLEICREPVVMQVQALDLKAPSGFEWLAFNKLELQFYTIRHIQHHTRELCKRLGATDISKCNRLAQSLNHSALASQRSGTMQS